MVAGDDILRERGYCFLAGIMRTRFVQLLMRSKGGSE